MNKYDIPSGAIFSQIAGAFFMPAVILVTCCMAWATGNNIVATFGTFCTTAAAVFFGWLYLKKVSQCLNISYQHSRGNTVENSVIGLLGAAFISTFIGLTVSAMVNIQMWGLVIMTIAYAFYARGLYVATYGYAILYEKTKNILLAKIEDAKSMPGTVTEVDLKAKIVQGTILILLERVGTERYHPDRFTVVKTINGTEGKVLFADPQHSNLKGNTVQLRSPALQYDMTRIHIAYYLIIHG
jgi:hypothetical protein